MWESESDACHKLVFFGENCTYRCPVVDAVAPQEVVIPVWSHAIEKFLAVSAAEVYRVTLPPLFFMAECLVRTSAAEAGTVEGCGCTPRAEAAWLVLHLWAATSLHSSQSKLSG